MKHKEVAIMLGVLFIPLGFLYTYQRCKGMFWESLFLYGLTLLFCVGVAPYMLILYIIAHFISLFRFFVFQENSFYQNYPLEDYNLQDNIF